MAATKKKARAPRRKKAEAGSKGLPPKDMLSGTESLEALQRGLGGFEIGAPDITAVNEAGNEGDTGEVDGAGLRSLATNQIQLYGLHPGVGDRG